ncbi:hypothetical protein DAPPUDRAFT_320232 [Daphnia pulex]|uniref:Uncharacterized protein n=1 Tax=Daphnia pulex TaxID=6669 RepID=E9GP93_DAPPU|nr:hypothetical protein DAPPUDRAFT_320232 [Daphnia pulex]|eukprot:EFX78721.1 hypothetical protein DAPPUDRAFT_320232 [Daphnia pulex]
MEARRELMEKEKDRSHGKGKRFKGNQSHQVEFGAVPTNARGYKGRSGQSKPVLRQVPVEKVKQDNNSTEQPKTDDDYKKFVPCSIHEKEVREFWRKELKAGD